MRGLAKALLLAPALVSAAPSRMEIEKIKDASPSTFVTFEIPPGFDEDKPQPYASHTLLSSSRTCTNSQQTLHLEVLEAPSPCAYPNIRVNDNPLSQGGHTLGRGTFAGEHDGSTFIASWTTTCADDEQLLRFNLESLAGRSLSSEVGFVARFRQTSPAAIIEVAGPVSVSAERPAPGKQGHRPRPGDDEDRLLDDPPFPPPPHHRVGNHHEEAASPPRRPNHGSSHREHNPEIEAELRDLDCLHRQIHHLKHLVHEKEARLEKHHGISPRHRALRDCDSLKCVLDTLMHRVGGGFRGGFHGFGKGGHRHHHPAPTCDNPFAEHGKHNHGNHTIPPPPSPPGFCHCAPPHKGKPSGGPDEHRGPPHHGHDGPHGPPPPPFDEPPHSGHHHGPPPPPPFDEPPHHGGPPPPPPPPGPPDDEHEHPLAPFGDHHGSHPHIGHGGPHPPPLPPMPLPLKLAFGGIFFLLFALLFRFRILTKSAKPRRRNHQSRSRRSRNDTAALKSLLNLFSRAPVVSDEEKRAFLSGHSLSDTEDEPYNPRSSMTSEITQFRNAATVVTELVAAEEGRARRQHQQFLFAQQQQQRQHSSSLPPPPPQHHHQQQQQIVPPSPTTAFAEYMGDDVLPTYDEAAPEVVVSDGFSSYSPGPSVYTPSVSDGPVGLDDVLGDTTSKT
ncbi:hypothetical protein Cob_v009857 [Colletotrichum orbiculare MAFF 240422]|uniref:Uncharacterized protein n=1 Tax=Colletotrichum orbiculare (strain 104-T / ATCC 96160 / CBS 514.97 / LARS 414 / MAFF 240422) TaxID=1213857 RepID=N4VPJ4_COLOR|nr:hypothetical protein Cob_v009857 [Colletotrichum orbiculare MAFF 240422]